MDINDFQGRQQWVAESESRTPVLTISALFMLVGSLIVVRSRSAETLLPWSSSQVIAGILFAVIGAGLALSIKKVVLYTSLDGKKLIVFKKGVFGSETQLYQLEDLISIEVRSVGRRLKTGVSYHISLRFSHGLVLYPGIFSYNRETAHRMRDLIASRLLLGNSRHS